MKDVNGKDYYVGMDVVMGLNNWKMDVKEDKVMKELFVKLVGLGEEFGVMGRVKGGVRDWSGLVGLKVEDNKEEFIRRVIVGCSLNFNYIEEGVEGLKSEVLWDWVKGGMKREELKKFNLVSIREGLYDRCVGWLDGLKFGMYGMELSYRVKFERFWNELWVVYGKDVVSKRVNLVRMILKESGIEIWDMDKKEIVVDYNLLGVMKYVGLIDYEGGFKDKKKDVDKLRVKVYEVMEGLIEVCEEDESWLDGLLFWVGRKLREKGLIDVCLYYGCIDY